MRGTTDESCRQRRRAIAHHRTYNPWSRLRAARRGAMRTVCVRPTTRHVRRPESGNPARSWRVAPNLLFARASSSDRQIGTPRQRRRCPTHLGLAYCLGKNLHRKVLKKIFNTRNFFRISSEKIDHSEKCARVV